jgi:hypothetical protein
MHATELYLQEGDVPATKAFLKKLLKNGKRQLRGTPIQYAGLTSLCGVVSADLGEYWEAEQLLYAFFGQALRKHNVVERVVATALKLVELGHVNKHALNYNDLDDDLWADVTTGKDLESLPDFAKKKGNKQVSFPWTKYTIYHESHGHAFVFMVKEFFFMDAGKRVVSSAELHFRKIDDCASKTQELPPASFWTDLVVYGDGRDKGFVLSAKFCGLHDQTFNPLRTECEATLWARNVFTELEHFDAVLEVET